MNKKHVEKLSLPRNFSYKIITLDYESKTNFFTTFRIAEIRDAKSAEDWVKLFQNETNVTWRVAKTYICKERINIFRKDFRCQHNTDARFRGKNQKVSKNTGCKATLKISIKRFYDHKRFKTPDDEIKQFPCHVELYNVHNHSLDSADVLRFRDMSEETKTELKRLFQQGHGAMSAYHTLRMHYQMDAENYETLVADSSLLPSVSVIQHLLNKEFSLKHGAKRGKNKLENIKAFCSSYNANTSGKMAVVEVGKNVLVSVCTPIMMQTVLLVPQTKKLVLVDAWGPLDTLKHKVYFFVAPCVAGGAPIGCLITDVESQGIFETGLNMLKTCWPPGCDMIVTGPEIFMTAGDLERDALQNIWPNCTILLSQFHVLKSLWSWLCEANHGILSSDRKELFFAFKSMMYAASEDEFEIKTNFMASIMTVKDYPNFEYHINELLADKGLWANYLRRGLPIMDNNVDNNFEIVFRIMKDTALSRVKILKIHSLVQLVDFITTGYENNLRRKYLDFSSGKYMQSLLQRFIKKYDEEALANVTFDTEDNIFTVITENSSYFVDINSSFCSCIKGSTSELCSHIWNVLRNLKIESALLYSDVSREILHKVATGKDLPSKNLSEPISFDPNQSSCSSFLSSPVPSCSKIQSDDDDMDNCSLIPETENDIAIVKEDENSIKSLEQLYNRIIEGLKNNPAVFKPAVDKMVQNAKMYAATERELISAMHNFGTFGVPKPVTPCLKEKKMPIRAEVTALAMKKALSGLRKIQPRKPVILIKLNTALKKG